MNIQTFHESRSWLTQRAQEIREICVDNFSTDGNFRHGLPSLNVISARTCAFKVDGFMDDEYAWYEEIPVELVDNGTPDQIIEWFEAANRKHNLATLKLDLQRTYHLIQSYPQFAVELVETVKETGIKWSDAMAISQIVAEIMPKYLGE